MRYENIDCHIQLGLKVAYYRKLRGLTQRQLAEGNRPQYLLCGRIGSAERGEGHIGGRAV